MSQFLVVDTLSAFMPDELEDFGLVVVSPFFLKQVKNHKHEDLALLYAYVRECITQKTDFEKEKAFARVYEGRDYSDSTINSLMSNLLRLVYQYIHLRQQNYQSQPNIQLSAATFYRERRMNNRFQSALDQLRKTNAAAGIRDKEQLYLEYLTEFEDYKFQSLYNQRVTDVNIVKTLQVLDEYYAISKLELGTTLLAQGQETQLQVEEILPIDSITELLNNSPKALAPLVRCFLLSRHIINYSNADKGPFLELKALISEYGNTLPLTHVQMFCTFLRNYCAGRINLGETIYLGELFSLYQEHLREGYLFEEGGLLPHRLQGIIKVGLIQKENDWVYRLLTERKYPIVGTQRPDALYNFYLAQYHFSVGQFNRAEDLLIGENSDSYYQLFKDERMVIEALLLELKIYYETHQQDDFLQDKLKAFRIKIVRKGEKSISPVYLEAALNFVKIFQKILLYRGRIELASKSKVAAIVQNVTEIIATLPTPITERDWILGKLTALTRRNSSIEAVV